MLGGQDLDPQGGRSAPPEPEAVTGASNGCCCAPGSVDIAELLSVEGYGLARDRGSSQGRSERTSTPPAVADANPSGPRTKSTR